MASSCAKAYGRHLYFEDLCNLADGKYAAGPMPLPKIRRKLIRIHCKSLCGLPSDVRQRYVRRASFEAATKRSALQGRTAVLQEELQGLQEQVAERAIKRKPLMLSNAYWNSKDLELFENLLSHPDFAGSNLLRLLDKACYAPRPLAAGLVEALDRQAAELPALPTMPDWVRSVAKLRFHFQDWLPDPA